MGSQTKAFICLATISPGLGPGRKWSPGGSGHAFCLSLLRAETAASYHAVGRGMDEDVEDCGEENGDLPGIQGIH